MSAVERSGRRPLQVGEEAAEVGQLALQGLQGLHRVGGMELDVSHLQQESADLLVDPSCDGESCPRGAVLHPQLGAE